MTAATGGSVSAPVPADDPRMIAWKKYQATEGYVATIKQAMGPAPLDLREAESRRRSVEGSIWAAFIEGFEARDARARYEAIEDGEDEARAETFRRLGEAESARDGAELPGQGDES